MPDDDALSEALDHLLDWLDRRYILHYSQEIHKHQRSYRWEAEKREFRLLAKEVLRAQV